MKKNLFVLSVFVALIFCASPFVWAQDLAYGVGDSVQVFRNGQGNKGKVLKIENGFYEVSFYSYYKNYHEILPASRLRNSEMNADAREVHASQKPDPEQNLPPL